MAAPLSVDNLLMESDSQIVINSILGEIKAWTQIINHITDIVTLARKFKNIKFNYCDKNADRLAGVIVKRSHCTISGLYYCYNE